VARAIYTNMKLQINYIFSLVSPPPVLCEIHFCHGESFFFNGIASNSTTQALFPHQASKRNYVNFSRSFWALHVS